MRARNLASLSVFSLLFVACGSSVNANDAADGSAPDVIGETSDDATTGTDVVPESAADAPADIAPDRPIIPTRGGQITASIIDLLGGQSIGAAFFYQLTGADPNARCTRRTTGACTVTDCRARVGGDGGAGSDGGGTMGHSANAGAITIAGRPGTPSMVLMPDMNGNYRPAFTMGALWSAGDMLTFAVAGAEVPSFVTMVTFPTPAVVTSPMPMSILTPVDVSRATGLTATWTPGTGSITIFLGQGGTAGSGAFTMGVLVECVYPSSAGTGILPPAALTETTDSTGMIPDAFLAVIARSSRDVTAGEYVVTVNATGGGLFSGARVGP